ncbi:NAD-dependent epimerase/dehydratase family protein [Providencia rustigianii]|uniref:SDR family oxidoreductase n=1 Tax=Providencia rustigianii TaxID=158850 RepID=UPI000F701BF4|nr:SDR family oxidoreductase [Providencia rustigianii]MTC61705.1 NAD-dependent epimerase/dehydratase family protein [Providencia rustigianii]VEH54736.1 nucleotide sugar dehydrogenase [Providencia rustigianii]
MKKITIIGLGWLGLPLANALMAQGMRVTGTKTHADGVEAARAVGIDCYKLQLTPNIQCNSEDLNQLMKDSDVMVILLPPSKVTLSEYVLAIEQLVDSAIAYKIPRIIFTSSTSVYGDVNGVIDEESPLLGETASARALIAVEHWMHGLPNIRVDVLRLAGLVGEKRHAGRFLAGKQQVKGGNQPVNMVHQDDVISAIILLIQQSEGGNTYNLCAPEHPTRKQFYTHMAQSIGLVPPEFMVEEHEDAGKTIDGGCISADLGFEYQFINPLQMPMS